LFTDASASFSVTAPANVLGIVLKIAKLSPLGAGVVLKSGNNLH